MGGVIPAYKAGTYPNGADRYVSYVTPQTNFVSGETNSFGAAYVGVMPIQMSYAASMDMELAPHTTPVGVSSTFVSDGFAPLNISDPAINVNNQGFKQEDFNYSLVASLWENTRAVDGSPEYTQDAQNGLIVWGNPSTAPNLNYAIQPAEARDGVPYIVAADDDTFHPHDGVTVLSDLATHQAVTHFRVTSSLGATILTAPVGAASSKPAKPKRSFPDNPLDPELLAGGGPIARNLYYQLHTGFLGTGGTAP
jgi:hypothetical protein